MDDRLQYKLFNLEVTPPDNAWDNIESVLNNEKAESLIHRFNHYTVNPPSDTWEKIKNDLSVKEEKNSRLIIFSFPRMAAAAAIIGVIITASWFFFQGVKNESVTRTVAVTSLVVPGLEESKGEFKPTNPNASPALKVERIIAPAPVIKLSKEETSHFAEIERSSSYSTGKIPLKASNQLPIYIKAPAIIGKDGRPVIDYQLLISQDKKYITVTSPNGQQTRISSKFLPVLSYFAGHGSSTIDSYNWRNRIEQWKQRLLEDPDFIPGAGNFMDLPELTEVFDEQ